MSRPIIDGSSLTGTSVQAISAAINTNRNCTILISNHSDSSLVDPNHYSKSGYSHAPPQPTIEPFTKDACSFSKAAEAATGAVGVLTYRFGNSSTRFALMFSVPYDFNLYTSWFGLAIIDEEMQASEAMYQEMYYGKESADAPDRKRAKAKDGITLHVEKGEWKISATMSQAKKAIIQVEVTRKGGHHHHCQSQLPSHGGWKAN